jgi:hypothetical protein
VPHRDDSPPVDLTGQGWYSVNIAVPALVILLGVLPGMVCFFGYFGGKFERHHAGVSAGEELALYVVLSVPINAFALAICRSFDIELNFAAAATLLSGNNTDAAIARVAAQFRDFSYLSAIVYGLILGGSYALGAITRRFVWAFRLDTWIPLLRMKHDWFYVLQARQKRMTRHAIAFVDVLTRHTEPAESSRLYRGLVAEFEVSSTGSIDSITLTIARRGSGRGDRFEWKKIPSDRFVIMGSSIHSINVSYLAIDDRPDGYWQRFLHQVRACVRSFVLEEA